MMLTFDPDRLCLLTYRDEASTGQPMHLCSLMKANITTTDWAQVVDWKRSVPGQPVSTDWRPTLTVQTISAIGGWKINAAGNMPDVAATWVVALEDDESIERWLMRIEGRISEWNVVMKPQETVYWKPKKHEARSRGYIIKHKFEKGKLEDKPETRIKRDPGVKKHHSYTQHPTRQKALAPANFTAAPPSPRPKTPEPLIPDSIIDYAQKGKTKKVMQYIQGVEAELKERYGRHGIIHGYDHGAHLQRKQREIERLLEASKRQTFVPAGVENHELETSHYHHHSDAHGGNGNHHHHHHHHHPHPHERPTGQPKWDRWLSANGDRLLNSVAAGQGHDRGKFRPRKELLKELLALGCDIDGKDGVGATAVFSCAQHDDVRMLFALTELGANVHIPNNEQVTPMNIACASGFMRCADHLLHQGADVNCEDCRGITPFFTACAQGYTEIADMILEEAHPKPDVNKVSHRGQVALLAAVHRGMRRTTELLLQCGANPNHQMDPIGTTALMIASELRADEGTAEIVRLLIMWGAKIELQDQFWRNAFHTACRNRNYPVVKVLVAACQTPEEIHWYVNRKDTERMTPLAIATENGDDETLRLMSDEAQWGNITPYLRERELERFDAVLKEYMTERFGLPCIGKLQFCKPHELSDNCGISPEAYGLLMDGYGY